MISAARAEELKAEGAEEIGSQWIETDKNEGLRTETNSEVEMKLKSRLVGRGDEEKRNTDLTRRRPMQKQFIVSCRLRQASS